MQSFIQTSVKAKLRLSTNLLDVLLWFLLQGRQANKELTCLCVCTYYLISELKSKWEGRNRMG